MHFHFLKKKYSLADIWKKRIEAFLTGAAIILFWRGVWNISDLFLFPGDHMMSAFASLFIGMGILILMRNFVNQFLDDAIEEID